jgi:hypothetical protein
MFREIDPESNNGSSHRNSSWLHHIEGQGAFALDDAAVLYMVKYNELQ